MEKDRASDFISKQFKKIVSRSYDLPNACPIETGVYAIKKIKVQGDLLPSFLSISDMNLTLKGKLCSKEKIKSKVKKEICFTQLVMRILIHNS